MLWYDGTCHSDWNLAEARGADVQCVGTVLCPVQFVPVLQVQWITMEKEVETFGRMLEEYIVSMWIAAYLFWHGIEQESVFASSLPVTPDVICLQVRVANWTRFEDDTAVAVLSS